jgi:predicted adenine nucleotide alpha hydrolase (AANH) superfamily ATPase
VSRGFQGELDALMESLGARRPRLLLHACCGPCASSVLEALAGRFDITLLYYNPNIRPKAEYEKRLFWLRRLLEEADLAGSVPLLVPGYDDEAFAAAAAGLEDEPEGGSRCTACFRLRLTKTAELAAAGGFEFFCSTLSVSPHKDAVRINALGRELEEALGVRWLPSDFKKRNGYLRSTEISARYGLYRQSYCGCDYGRALIKEDF